MPTRLASQVWKTKASFLRRGYVRQWTVKGLFMTNVSKERKCHIEAIGNFNISAISLPNQFIDQNIFVLGYCNVQLTVCVDLKSIRYPIVGSRGFEFRLLLFYILHTELYKLEFAIVGIALKMTVSLVMYTILILLLYT